MADSPEAPAVSGFSFNSDSYMDRGTGLYPTPTEPVTVEGAVDNKSTHAYPTPTEPVTYSSGIVPAAEKPATAPDSGVVAATPEPAPEVPAAPGAPAPARAATTTEGTA